MRSGARVATNFGAIPPPPRPKVAVHSGLPRRSQAETQVPALPYLEKSKPGVPARPPPSLQSGVCGEPSRALWWLYFAFSLGNPR